MNGLVTSGAGGVNFSYSNGQHNRTYISYLINGSDKMLSESIRTEHYVEEGAYTTHSDLEEESRDLAHRFNFGMRRRIDSTHNLIIDGNVNLMYNDLISYTETSNIAGDQLVNRLLSERGQESDLLSGNLIGTYNRMFQNQKSTLKLSGTALYSKNLEDILISNETGFQDEPATQAYNQFQNNQTDQLNLSLVTSFTQKIGKGLYISPWIRLGGSNEHLERIQGSLANGMEPVDSISPSFDKAYRWIRPAVNFKYNTEKSQLTVGLITELGILETSLNDVAYPRTNHFYLTPMVSWDYSRTTGRKINFMYNSSVNTPTVNQLLPVVNKLNPLNIYYGNPQLSPEFSHRFMAHWLIFDQFSFTSLMMALSGEYTTDKINWSTSVTDDLVQISTLTNVDWDYRGRLNLDFSTPIRKLGVKVNLDVEESWNRGQSIVNDAENIYDTFSQRYSVSPDNRKKKRWDVESGLGAVLTHTRYDIQESLNANYFDLSWFGDIRYTPTEKWNFMVTADVTGYSSWGRDESILIPLLRAEVSYYFLKHNRGVLALSGNDLLDKNQNLVRISELNYMRETRSNTIGRYVMLTFKYRLNKFAREGGIEVDFHRKR